MTKQELMRELKIARSSLAVKSEQARVAQSMCNTLQMKVESLVDRIKCMKNTSWAITALERYKVLYERVNDEITKLQWENGRREAEAKRLSKRASKARGKARRKKP